MRLLIRALKGVVGGRDGRPANGTETDRVRTLYLELLQECLLGTIYRDPSVHPKNAGIYDPVARELGVDWPARAHSMIGRKRMRNLRALLEHILIERIPGDVIETGVWRGGACIFMRAVFKAYDVSDRKVWLADSFQGLPPPDAGRYPADAGDTHHTFKHLAVSLDEVKANFAAYGLLDEQVDFLAGWFKDTLPKAPIASLALMRLDGDMYESTMDALVNLYHRLSPGGFVIIDDYKATACRQAVHDFRGRNELIEPLQAIDGSSMYWQRSYRTGPP